MFEITSIEKGIVIDHITAGYGIQVFNYLNLDTADYNVALSTMSSTSTTIFWGLSTRTPR